MADIKKLKNYHRSRRTQKIVESLEEKQQRHNAFLRLLDETADKILSGRSTASAPTADELAEMKRQKPEVGELLEMMFDVADKLKK